MLLFLNIFLLIINSFFTCTAAAGEVNQNGIYSECIKNGDFAITFGKGTR